MIVAILCFHFSRIGINKFLNFIFFAWTYVLNYLCLASLLVWIILCFFKKTSRLFKLFLPVMLIAYVIFALCVLYRNFSSTVIAGAFALEILFGIILMVHILFVNMAKWKKVLLILL